MTDNPYQTVIANMKGEADAHRAAQDAKEARTKCVNCGHVHNWMENQRRYKCECGALIMAPRRQVKEERGCGKRWKEIPWKDLSSKSHWGRCKDGYVYLPVQRADTIYEQVCRCTCNVGLEISSPTHTRQRRDSRGNLVDVEIEVWPRITDALAKY